MDEMTTKKERRRKKARKVDDGPRLTKAELKRRAEAEANVEMRAGAAPEPAYVYHKHHLVPFYYQKGVLQLRSTRLVGQWHLGVCSRRI